MKDNIRDIISCLLGNEFRKIVFAFTISRFCIGKIWTMFYVNILQCVVPLSILETLDMMTKW